MAPAMPSSLLGEKSLLGQLAHLLPCSHFGDDIVELGQQFVLSLGFERHNDLLDEVDAVFRSRLRASCSIPGVIVCGREEGHEVQLDEYLDQEVVEGSFEQPLDREHELGLE